MIQNLLNSLQINASNDDFDTRRKHERYKTDDCIAIIEGTAYPVENWSEGGLLLKGDERTLALEDVKDVTIKFKLEDRITNIMHKARVLRKGRDKFVMQFYPLTQEAHHKFKQIIDHTMMQEFASSQ